MTTWIAAPLPTFGGDAGSPGAHVDARQQQIEQILADAREARAVANQAEVAIAEAALAWAQAHIVTDPADAAYVALACGDSDNLPMGADGAPMVADWCIAPFAATQGLSTAAGQQLIGDVVELAYRLPRLWGRVRAAQVRLWRAQRVASSTTHLSAAAAAYVDRHIAGSIHSQSGPAIQRLIDEAEARFMPQVAAEREALTADGRHVTIDTDAVSFTDTVEVFGTLNRLDALDLEKAIATGAARLKELGNTAPLDVRRALAVGEMARDQLAFGFSSPANPAAVRPLTRQVVLHVHLSAEAITGSTSSGADELPGLNGPGFARLENGGNQLLTPAQVAAWCGADASRITVRPIIDLADEHFSESYEVPDQLREQIINRDRHCVFPWCTRNARSCDLDHIVGWDAGGDTTSTNLAPLCRRHHNAKTHHRWRYHRRGPATYIWYDPYGHTYRVDPTGTTDISPEAHIDASRWGSRARSATSSDPSPPTGRASPRPR